MRDGRVCGRAHARCRISRTQRRRRRRGLRENGSYFGAGEEAGAIGSGVEGAASRSATCR